MNFFCQKKKFDFFYNNYHSTTLRVKWLKMSQKSFFLVPSCDRCQLAENTKSENFAQFTCSNSQKLRACQLSSHFEFSSRRYSPLKTAKNCKKWRLFAFCGDVSENQNFEKISSFIFPMTLKKWVRTRNFRHFLPMQKPESEPKYSSDEKKSLRKLN